MPRVTVPGVGDVNFPDTMSPGEIKEAIEREILPLGSKSKQEGKQYAKESTTGPALLNAANGLTFGFGDEIAGGLNAAKEFVTGGDAGAGYRSGRDFVRGAVEQHRQDYPVASTVGNISGALLQAPMIPIKALGAGAGLLTRAATGAGYGAAFGAAQGAGDSETIDSMMADAAGGGIKGAAIGGALPVVGAAVSGASNMARPYLPSLPPALMTIADKMGLRFDGAISEQLALREIGKQMAREGKTGSQVTARLGKLGPEATLADATGLETLDTMANLPGKTRQAAANAIRQRQTSRADRMDQIPDSLAGTATKGDVIVRDLKTLQEEAAAPLYAEVDKLTVPITPALADIANRPVVRDAIQLARNTVANKGQAHVDAFDAAALDKNQMPLRFWDEVKRGLDDIIGAAKRGDTNKTSSTLGSALDVKRELVNELDTLTSKTGKAKDSPYYQARQAFAGPAATINAIEDGRKVLTMKDAEIAEWMFKAGQSEVEAFRLGAADALRDKIGTRGGINNLLNAPFDRSTRMMMKSVFGDENGYREAMKTILREGQLRKLESVNGGSATARRLANQEDVAGSVIEAATAAKTGDPFSIVRAGRSLAGRLGTPEVVRDDIGQMLLMKGGDKLRGKSRDELIRMIDEVAKSIAMGNSQAAAISGVLGGSIPLR